MPSSASSSKRISLCLYFSIKKMKYFENIVINRSYHLQDYILIFIYKYCNKIQPNFVCKFAVMSSAFTFNLKLGKVIFIISTTYAVTCTSSLQAGPERCSLEPFSSSAFWVETDWSCSTRAGTWRAEKGNR